jgi:CheY-like chemotaxis protein
LTYVEGQVTFAISPLIRGKISLARKILLADDSVTAQNMGRKILADAGYEVIAVNNGSAALKKIAELKPDLVILDVYMPGYSGLEVCQRLKESQETARIPVLLTVGKLEPFKPEEAQRVRAEGFIVKPFEASELLSALSKLEDKVVPRAEPSKPGRFARAIAAAEESGRGSRKATADGDNGWKNRIGFPHEKTEPEEKPADEAPIYNPMNRDLRTVVETAGEKATKNEKRQHSEKAETTVDVAALAPAGLPNDVTPEEVAAIAAAAAQIQMAGATIEGDHQVSESKFAESHPSGTEHSEITSPVEATLPPRPDVQSEVHSDFVPPVAAEATMEALTDKKEESKIESMAGESVAAVAHDGRIGDKKPQETADEPVTMAATADSVAAASAGGSRWTAVSVALDAEEATVSLDQEMQKAYAAFAATETNSVAAAPQVESVPAPNSFADAEAAVEAPVPAISIPEPEPVPQPEFASATNAEAAAPPSSFMPADFAVVEPVSEPVIDSIQQPEAAIPTAAQFAEPTQESAPVAEFSVAVPQTEVADSGALAPQESQPAPEPGPAIAESAASSAFAPIVRSSQDAAEPAAEPKLDPETVKTTAAAWASWRQIRDTGKTEAAHAMPAEFDLPESAPADTAARAVAAGAEQILQQASTASSPSDPTAIASIVDSVLADLRPKLMEEISRKMAEKK